MTREYVKKRPREKTRRRARHNGLEGPMSASRSPLYTNWILRCRRHPIRQINSQMNPPASMDDGAKHLPASYTLKDPQTKMLLNWKIKSIPNRETCSCHLLICVFILMIICKKVIQSCNTFKSRLVFVCRKKSRIVKVCLILIQPKRNVA